MEERVTFAVVGRNEEASLPLPVTLALEAAEPGDRVWYVDSGSTDGSAEAARRLGAEVIAAPAGKGRAMQAAVDACTDGYLCFLDADYRSSEHNIPKLVRAATAESGADLVVGAYDEPERRTVTTPLVYRPIVAALFPEAVDAVQVPFSGFRAVRIGTVRSPLPHGYGVEAHLNVEAALAGDRIANCPVGEFHGDLRGYANLPTIFDDVATALLDLAERWGRLPLGSRRDWEAWVDVGRAITVGVPGPSEDATAFETRLAELAARPAPPA